MNHLEKTLIIEAIKRFSDLAKTPLVHPATYKILAEDVVILELREELERLENALNQPQTFTQWLIDRASERDEGVDAIPVLQNPATPANFLYAELIKIILQPKNLKELLHVLAPSISTTVQVAITIPLVRARMPLQGDTIFPKQEHQSVSKKKSSYGFEAAAVPVLHSKENAYLDKKLIKPDFFENDPLEYLSAELNVLAECIIAGKRIFPLPLFELHRYPLDLFIKFLRELSHQYPGLSEAMATHNQSFRTLFHDMEIVMEEGMTLRMRLEFLIKELRIGGSKVDGTIEDAGLIAKKGWQSFYQHYRALPIAIKDAFNQLNNGALTFGAVINRVIQNGHCVEETADHLELILNAHRSHPLLNQLDNKEVQALRAKYHDSIFNADFSLQKQIFIQSKLPGALVQKVMQKFELSNADELSLLLANTPFFEVPGLLTSGAIDEMRVEKNSEMLKSFLKILKNNFISASHFQAIATSLEQSRLILFFLEHSDASRKLLCVLFPCFSKKTKKILVRSETENAPLLKSALQDVAVLRNMMESLPFEELSSLLTVKYARGSYVLEDALEYPDSFQYLLSLFPSDIRQLQIHHPEDKFSLIERAFYHPQSFTWMLSLFNAKEIYPFITKEDEKKNTILSSFLSREAFDDITVVSFAALLTALPNHDVLLLLKQASKNGDTALHLLQKHPSLFIETLNRFPKAEQLEQVQKKNHKGVSLLHLAAINIECLNAVVALYHDPSLLNQDIITRDENGNTVFHYAIHAANEKPIKKLLSTFPRSEWHRWLFLEKNKQLECVMESSLGRMVLMDSRYQFFFNLSHVFEELTDSGAEEWLKTKIGDETLFHQTARWWNVFSYYFQRIPEAHKDEMLFLTDNKNLTVLYRIALNKAWFNLLFSKYSEQERYQLITRANQKTDAFIKISTYFFCWSSTMNTTELLMLFSPKNQKKLLVHPISKQSVIFEKMQPDMVNAVIQKIPAKLLAWLISKNNPSWKAIWRNLFRSIDINFNKLITKLNDNAYLHRILLTKGVDRPTLFEDAIKYLEDWTPILATYPPEIARQLLENCSRRTKNHIRNTQNSILIESCFQLYKNDVKIFISNWCLQEPANLLYALDEYPTTFERILKNSGDDTYAVLRGKVNDKIPLFKTVRNPETIQIILNCIPATEKVEYVITQLVQERDYLNTFSDLQTIVKSFTLHDQIQFFSHVDAKGTNLISKISLAVFVSLMPLCREISREKALELFVKDGQSCLVNTVSCRLHKEFKEFIDLYHPRKRLRALLARNAQGHSFLDQLNHDLDIEFLHIMLEALPADDAITALTTTISNNSTLLYEYCRYRTLHTIYLKNISKEQRRAFYLQLVGEKSTALQKMLEAAMPHTLIFPKMTKAEIISILKKPVFPNGKNHLHQIEDVLPRQFLCELLPEDELVSLLKDPLPNGHMIFESPVKIDLWLPVLPEELRLQVAKLITPMLITNFPESLNLFKRIYSHLLSSTKLQWQENQLLFAKIAKLPEFKGEIFLDCEDDEIQNSAPRFV